MAENPILQECFCCVLSGRESSRRKSAPAAGKEAGKGTQGSRIEVHWFQLLPAEIWELIWEKFSPAATRISAAYAIRCLFVIRKAKAFERVPFRPSP